MKHYYLNLPKEKELDFNTNLRVSSAIQFTAKRALEPFEGYLQNAITALEKKENIQAKWKKIKTENIAELRLIGKLFEISKQTIIQIDENLASELQEATSIMGSASVHKVVSIHGNNLVFDVLPIENEMLFWNNQPLNYKVVESERPKGTIIKEEQNRSVVYAENGQKPENATEIPNKKLANFIDFEQIRYENGKTLNATRNDELNITLSDISDFGKTVIYEKLKFKIENTRKNSKDAYWIQLLEIDKLSDEDVPGFSPLKYFFDDGIEIEDDKNNKYQVAAGVESENKIVLKKKNEKGHWNFGFPPDNSILTVKVNTYQLKKQIEAISTLMRMPVGEQAKLIKLFENREKTEWQKPDSSFISEWVVLTDMLRSGTLAQRQFVGQALNTPDFAILEGPPGSGKTTVILELICQLARQGKRILLCGSTHVAIDNVLERLKEKRNGKSLMEQFHILPVRIGDEQRISDDIKEFQINNLKENYAIDEQLLLDISNLVCGTTIGILQHPKFKQRKGTIKKDNKDGRLKYFSSEPIIPEFDYLIIDESSKTTFQEFLVPALYAKKWILVGDVMQLSPFTDREEVVSNIEQMSIDGEQIPLELQQAVFYLQKLKDILFYEVENKKKEKSKHNKFVLPVDFKVLIEIQIELEIRQNSDFNNKIIFLIHKGNINECNKLELSATDIIFIESHLLEPNLHLIPESHAILRSEKWTASEHAFIHNVYQQKHSFSHKEKGREMNNSFDITEFVNTHFIEKSWAEEIAWRVDREHQIRLTHNQKLKGQYGKIIEELIPKTLDQEKQEKVEEQINSIASMAFPSVLESLVKGVLGRKLKFESTISEGFKPEDLKYRKMTLKYQHRMHPDISKFPREQYYLSDGALLDVEMPQNIKNLRQWTYNQYPKRSVWLDVKGKTEKNKNREEVKMLIKELREFIEYAKNNTQPEGKEWSVACLTFYRGQETLLREELQKLTGNENGYSNFNITSGKHKINIKLHTVDKFQGQEADIVFLSMVQTTRDGFLDNPNRLNVAITRAKFQLVIIGHHDYFIGKAEKKSQSEDLRKLAENTQKI